MIPSKQLTKWERLSYGLEFGEIIRALIVEIRDLSPFPKEKLPRIDAEAAYFRQMRRFLGWRQKQVAEKLGVSQVAVSHYETGHCRYSQKVKEQMEQFCRDEKAVRDIPEFRPPVAKVRRRRAGIKVPV